MSLRLLRALAVFAPLIAIVTTFWGTLSLLVSFFDKGGRVQAWLAQIWAKQFLFVTFIRVKVNGLEKIDPKRSYIIVSNHLSYTDTPVMLANIPLQFRFMAKQELLVLPFVGGHLRRAGHIMVPLDNPREAIKAMNEAGKMIRERQISVLIFPEGGRTNNVLEPFKEGAAMIAIKAGVPIVPCGLIGTYQRLPSDSIELTPGPVTLNIGDPIETTSLGNKDRERLTQQLYERVRELSAT